MRTDATSDYAAFTPWPAARPFGLLRFVGDRFLWLPIGALVAITSANLAPDQYFPFRHALAFPVNEIGMALFVGLVAHEALDALRPGGALHRWRHWATALVAAAGGLAGTALVFLTFVTWRDQPMLVPAWPVAAAIDIAAGYYVLAAIFRRGAVFPFLLLIAVATDGAGLLAMALWPGFSEAHLLGAPFVLLGVAAAAGLRRAGVRHPAPYVFGAGAIAWWGFYVAGVPAALALVPIAPFVPPSRRLLAPFTDRPAAAGVDREARPWLATVHVVLFFFGLVNGGVVLRGYDTGTWAVLLAALVGRPVGILASVALARTTGLRLPQAIGWRELTVIALATSSGFTFALFAAASLLPVGGVLTQIRVGALATAAGAAVTLLVARALRVGRFAHAAH